MTKPESFNPDDDFDAMADAFRRLIPEAFLEAEGRGAFDRLTETGKLQCLLCGVLTGALGVAFAHVAPSGRDDVMRMLADYLPQARLNAEDIMREGRH